MSDDEVKDRILLRRAIYQKDRKALGRLHSIYYPRIKRYIASRVNSIPDAEDLTQGVFFELCNDEDTYREYQDAEAYLFGIAKNLIALYYRSQSKQVKTISMESVGETAADVQQKPAEQISQQELKDIKDLIARLPPKAQEAIRLIFIEGLSLKEAAKRTGCSIHTFCQQIYEGKIILKKLKPRFHDER
ncbi:MAG: RNA polymerase sigma factor [Planctomycetota bacterium]|jgi:RNA polymerase sigma-70 factor (ECF subfamily)